jgi:hypothetical protein
MIISTATTMLGHGHSRRCRPQPELGTMTRSNPGPRSREPRANRDTGPGAAGSPGAEGLADEVASRRSRRRYQRLRLVPITLKSAPAKRKPVASRSSSPGKPGRSHTMVAMPI